MKMFRKVKNINEYENHYISLIKKQCLRTNNYRITTKNNRKCKKKNLLIGIIKIIITIR